MTAAEAFAEYRARSRLAVDQNSHHDQRRAQLQDLLREAFGIATADVELERNVRVAETRGRIDLLYRGLVFEVKRDLELEHDEVIRELELYMSESSERAFAIAVDGKRFEAYRLLSGKATLVGELTIEDSDDEAGVAWLDSYLFAQDAVTPTAEDVVRRFGPRSAVFIAVQDELAQMWDLALDQTSAATKRDEWDRLLRVVYGTHKGDDELFLRHTYLAIVARMFAFLAIEKVSPRADEAVDVLNGKAFQRLGIENLVEDDFFAWIAEPVVAEQARRVAEGVAKHLSIYRTDQVNEDLLKHLYETLVDPVDRHDLGEFYTPDWLASLVLREAGYKSGQRVLDPACGSGTFIFLAIRQLRQQGLSGEALVGEAEANLYGFDVHPLAVTVARANFILALRTDLRERRSAVTIPIWMANSLAVPEDRFGRPIEVPVPPTEGAPSQSFTLPTEMEDTAPGSLAKTVSQMSELAVLDASAEDAAAGLRTTLRELGVEQYADTWEQNLTLFRGLVKEKRDSIWGFVLSNAVRPQLVAREPVDLVVGNPPWLALRDVTESNYQNQLIELALKHGLLKQRRGWQTGALEMATVFACFALSHYLRKGGRLAFVVPRSVLFGAKQHEPFRQFQVSPEFTPEQAFDLAEVGPLFNVPSAVVIIRREGRPVDAEWPVRKVRGDLPSRNIDDAAAVSHLEIAAPVALKPQANIQSPYLERAIQGATLAPRPFWFVKVKAGERGKRPWCVTEPDAAKRAKKPWQGISLEREIEASFLFATTLAVFPFRLGPLKLCALPIALEEGAVRLLSSEEVLRRGGTDFFQWMQEGEELWQERKKDSAAQDVPLYRYLDNHRNLTRQRPGGTRVIYGADGSHVRAAVVEPRTVLSGLQPAPRAFIYDMNTYWVDVKSDDEAHYLVAVLNTAMVNDAIKDAQTQGAWGARHIHRRPFERVPIPEYVATDARHRKLAEISRAAHARLKGAPSSRTRAGQLQPVADLVEEAGALAAEICGLAIA